MLPKRYILKFLENQIFSKNDSAESDAPLQNFFEFYLTMLGMTLFGKPSRKA